MSQTEIKHAGTPFRRLAPVKVPTLKLEDDKAVFIKVTGPIAENPKSEMDKDGNVQQKVISVMPVVNLETGELAEIVVGAALNQNLRDYMGGNQAYVGLCFEIVKHGKADGKRWKSYSVFQIEEPAG